MPKPLFDREIVLEIGTRRIASRDATTGERKPILRVQFKIERTLQPEPNTADVSIFNLSKESRAAVQEKGILSEIEAGYFGLISLIFRGDLDYGSTVRVGPDWVTTFQASDGGKQFRSSRINLPFDAGTKIGDVINQAAKQLGVGLGNVASEVAKGIPRGTALQYVKGLVLSGQTSKEFTKILKRAGFGWSIQDNQIQLTRPGQVLNPGEAIVLNQATGLIGSPEQGEKGLIKVRSLLQPELQPGKRIQIQAGARDLSGVPEIDGFFRIEKTTFSGDTWGGDWYSDVEARPVT